MYATAPPVFELLQLITREATTFVRLRLASVLLLVIAAAILTALGPVALKLMVDAFTSASHGGALTPLLLVGLYVMSQWLARTADEIRGLIYRRVHRRILRTLSERLFTHLMHLPLRFHLDRQTGATSEALANGLEGLQLILSQLVLTVLPVIASLATVIVVLARTVSWEFLALFCAALTCYAIAFTYSAATLTASARSASAARVEAGAAITDSLLNYETVKCFTAEATVQERVASALARSETEWLVFSRQFGRNGLLVASIFAALLATTMAYATAQVLHGRMTVGDFVLINAYMLQLAQPVEMFGNAIQAISQGLAMLEKLMHLFREVQEPSPIHASLIKGPGTLEFDQISLSYRKHLPVLSGISFRILPKRTIAIVGPSGSGKSTIVRLLMRLLEPDGGQILLDGIPISSLSLPHLRSAIAVVPQDTVLFNDTLAYNIAFGRIGASLAEVQHASRVSQLHEFIMSLPEGYETRVGERGIKLSGGERQRVSIARAVLKAPRIYVFDEATSSLDSRTEQDILASVGEIAKHSSTLVIAHRLSTVIHADEILVLENGQITERGTHPGLLRQNGHYTTLWRAQHPDLVAV